jgi:hypothetical protein
MAATADELAAIRDHIGDATPPTDDDLQATWTRLGSVEAVALSYVRRRLADLTAKAAEFRADGDFTEKWADNIKRLERQEKALAAAVGAASSAAVVGAAGGVTVGHLTRSDRCR